MSHALAFFVGALACAVTILVLYLVDRWLSDRRLERRWRLLEQSDPQRDPRPDELLGGVPARSALPPIARTRTPDEARARYEDPLVEVGP